MKRSFKITFLFAIILIVFIVIFIKSNITNIKDVNNEKNYQKIEEQAHLIKSKIEELRKNNRSIELDKLEVRILSNGEILIKTQDDKEINVKTSNNILCRIVKIYNDGNVYVSECFVNDNLVDYEYLTKDEQKLSIYIRNLYNPNYNVVNNNVTYNVDTKNSLFDDGLGGKLFEGGNIRYYGKNPNNYIDIGERDENGNVVLWRIIGLFQNIKLSSGETKNLVKIIRDQEINKYAWDEYYNNNWSKSTLKKYLNGEYYNNNLSKMDKRIEQVVWNLGGWDTSLISVNKSYEIERGTDIPQGNLTESTGRIALMYPSDYGYASNIIECKLDLYNYDQSEECFKNNWLNIGKNQWLLTIDSTSVFSAWYVHYTGYVVDKYSYYDNYYYEVKKTNLVRPVLYLSDDTILVGNGNGSKKEYFVIN